MTKTEQILEHIVVTFGEAALAYIVVIPNAQLNKTAVAGAVGAGLSAVYNLVRQSKPTIAVTPVKPVVSLEQPLNGVEQLTVPVIPQPKG